MGKIVANIRQSKNSNYEIEEFYKIYPYFENLDIPEEVVNMYLEFANACIKSSIWRNGFKLGCGLFIAHFLILYIENSVDIDENNLEKIISKSKPKGLQKSKSVDGISVSYDFSNSSQDLTSWGNFNATSYGIQLVTLAKMYGKGLIYVTK